MVPFAGYEMPVQYDGMGVLKEHLHTRHSAGLFDVSHMGQALLTGDDPARSLEKIVPGDIAGLQDEQMRYTVLLNDKGGIIDDLMVTRCDEKTLFLVVNAACRDKDFGYIEKKIGGEVKLEPLPTRALMALQGPKAAPALARLIPAVAGMTFMTLTCMQYRGHEIYISRSGYTGEDGFEISVESSFAEDFAKELLENPDVKWAGLGARDSLRLEAGLCLYGHDLDENTTPVEANLKWTIPKRRREEGGFTGAEIVLAQLKDAPARLRVGLRPEGKAPVREGVEIFAEGRKIGVVTSGTFGPSVDAPVAMGYVEAGFSKPGTKVEAMVRGTARACEIVPLPFMKPNYKRD